MSFPRGTLRKSPSYLNDRTSGAVHTPDENVENPELEAKLAAKVESLKKEFKFSTAVFGILPMLKDLAILYVAFEQADDAHPEYKSLQVAAKKADEVKAVLLHIKNMYFSHPNKKEEIKKYCPAGPAENDFEKVLSYLIVKDFKTLHALQSGNSAAFQERVSKSLGFTDKPAVLSPYFKEWAEVNLLNQVTVNGDPEKCNIDKMVAKTENQIRSLRRTLRAVLKEMPLVKMPLERQGQEEVAKRVIEKWDPAMKQQVENKCDKGEYIPRLSQVDAVVVNQARASHGFYQVVSEPESESESLGELCEVSLKNFSPYG